MQLTACPNITISHSGALITGDLTHPEWLDAVCTLKTIKSAYLLALADLYGYGRNAFGEDQVAKDLEQLEFDLSDACKAAAISVLTLDFRSGHGLTSEHYYIISYLATDKDREKWAKLAVEHGLSALELKRSIAAGKVVTQKLIDTTSGRNTGINTLQGIRFQFDQWERQVGGDRQKLLRKPRAEREQMLENLTPIVAFAAEIEASLSAED